MENTLKKGDSFSIGDNNPATMAKIIAAKYNANPADFITVKKGSLTYSPKRVSKPKQEIICKPEDMSVEEYKEKVVIPLKPELKDAENEEWRPVPNKGRYFGGEADYSNYFEVSNLGRLRTINLQNAAKSSISSGYNAPTRNAMQFHLSQGNGMRTCPDVKYMVADAFLGEHDLENNMVIHIDGDYTNNRVDNLKWVPRKKKNNGDEPKENISTMINEAIKKAIKQLQFENKSGIHINPENKGKFNATKERTSKSTEELTHSKNPLTRKRAIFAQNAKKWNHKKVDENINSTCKNGDFIIQTAEQCGYDFDDCFDVHNPQTGEEGTRFVFRNTNNSCGQETFKSQLKNVTPNGCRLIFSKGQYRYAPEITNFSVVLICDGGDGELNEDSTEPMSNANNNKISVEDILKRIHDAGVDQAVSHDGTQTSAADNSNYEFHLGSYVYNAAQHKLTGPNGEKYLAARQADLLLLLCENLNKTVDRGTILKTLWRNEDGFSARSMDVYITSLRNLFNGDPNVNIYNVRGVGFRLEAK